MSDRRKSATMRVCGVSRKEQGRASGGSVLKLMICLATACGLAMAQELPRPLVRDRILNGTVEEVWERILRLVAQSDAIVNTVDPASHLLSLTIPMTVEDIKRCLLEAKDLPPQPLMTHIVMWARPAGQTTTRMFIRAAAGGGGIFVHSGGALEEDLFAAIESGKAWRITKVTEKMFAHSQEQVWQKTLNVIKGSGFTLSCANALTGVLTCTVDISSDVLNQFVTQKLKGHHPGIAHLTMWLSRAEVGTRVAIHSLILESENYAPPALSSTGRLEGYVLEMIAKGLSDGAAVLKIGTGYRHKNVFWWTLFNTTQQNRTTIKETGLRQPMPASLDDAWKAVITVISQFAVIMHCDRQAGLITYIAAHANQLESKFSIHPMAMLLEATNSGVDVYVSAEGATETKDELAFEKQDLIDKIATQLFIREKLKWLLKSEEKTK